MHTMVLHISCHTKAISWQVHFCICTLLDINKINKLFGYLAIPVLGTGLARALGWTVSYREPISQSRHIRYIEAQTSFIRDTHEAAADRGPRAGVATLGA